MAKVDRRALFKHLKSDELARVYYVHGDDTFMLDAAVEAIVGAAIPGGKNEFNFDGFRGREASAQNIRPACEMLPMLSPKRVVLVRGIQDMPVSELNELTDYFVDPSPSTCLIMEANTTNKKPDGRGSAMKAMKKVAKTFEFPAFRDWEIGEALDRQIKRRGLNFQRDASALMIESIGPDLARLDEALERVELYLGADPPEVVTADHVGAIVAVTREHNVFALTDALGGRDIARAMKILDSMLLGGQSEIGMVAMISRHFRILGKFHDPTVKKMGKNDAARAIGIPPFFYNDYSGDAKRFTLAKIQEIQSFIADTDFALKSSRVPDREIVNQLMFNICLDRAA